MGLYLLYLLFVSQVGVHSGQQNDQNLDIIYDGKCVKCYNNLYMVLNNTLHEFPDKYTGLSNGCNIYYFLQDHEFSSLQSPAFLYKSECGKFRNGDALISRWDTGPRQKMIDLFDSQKSLIKDKCQLIPGTNNPILYIRSLKSWMLQYYIGAERKGRIVLIPEKYSNTTTFSVAIESGNLCQATNWLNMISSEIFSWNSSFMYVDYSCSDARLHEAESMNNQVFLIYSKLHNRAPDYRPVLIEFQIDLDKSLLSATDQVTVAFGHNNEKNWIPFDYNGKLYFLSSVVPLHVVRVQVTAWPHAKGHTISYFNISDSCFKFPFSNKGQHPVALLRGGTQALKIDNNTYIALFHSYSNLADEFDYGVLKTYMMGAYTFVVEEAENLAGEKIPTFRLTGLSKQPIGHKDWYMGPWFSPPSAFGNVDYVVYPTTIMLEDDNLFVVVGLQDREHWLIRLSLDDVLASMIDIPKDGICFNG